MAVQLSDLILKKGHNRSILGYFHYHCHLIIFSASIDEDDCLVEYYNKSEDCFGFEIIEEKIFTVGIDRDYMKQGRELFEACCHRDFFYTSPSNVSMCMQGGGVKIAGNRQSLSKLRPGQP